MTSGEGDLPDRRARRRAAMIDAGRTLFMEQGYDAVSLAAIVRRSGGSLSTFYAVFENKAGLLRAIVAEERFEGIERLDALVARGGSPAGLLRAIAESIHADLARPEMIRLMRVVMAKSLDDAAFAHAIYENAHQPRVEWLARLFARWDQAGAARIPDPMMAAQFFLGMTLHAAQTRALFGDRAGLQERTEAQCLTSAVEVFVAGYAIAAGNAGRAA
ncbi:TetR/AcrR family transcriptional regulator [Sphingomonas solaris]|nr:TetR/AcrR family transcriptional regulator [Sphingomonas solaris]